MKNEKLEKKAEENRKALEEAKKTGKNVVIRQTGWYDADPLDFGGENEQGIVTRHEIATPDGKILDEECVDEECALY